MLSAEIELKAQISALVKKTASTDEAERNEPDLDISARSRAGKRRLAAIDVAKIETAK